MYLPSPLTFVIMNFTIKVRGLIVLLLSRAAGPGKKKANANFKVTLNFKVNIKAQSLIVS